MSKYVGILVTGDRNAELDDWEGAVKRALRLAANGAEHVVLIHGDCRGIDKIAEDVARISLPGTAIVPMPYVDSAGKAGGPIRNQKMVDALSRLRDVGYRTVCIAFHDEIETSKGTKNCAMQAVKAGHQTMRVWSSGSFSPFTEGSEGA